MTQTVFVTLEQVRCANCHAIWGMAWGSLDSYRRSHKMFWCPYCGGRHSYAEPSDIERAEASAKRAQELLEQQRRFTQMADGRAVEAIAAKEAAEMRRWRMDSERDPMIEIGKMKLPTSPLNASFAHRQLERLEQAVRALKQKNEELSQRLDALEPAPKPAPCVLRHYDGMVMCLTHNRRWGVVTNPDVPCHLSAPAKSVSRAQVEQFIDRAYQAACWSTKHEFRKWMDDFAALCGIVIEEK